MTPHLKTAQQLTELLESRFNVAGYRFGLDPILGLVPGLGDAISLLLSLYLLWIAAQLKTPPEKINQMMANIAVDFFLGLVPLVGDVGDFLYKANSKNLAILLDDAKHDT